MTEESKIVKTQEEKNAVEVKIKLKAAELKNLYKKTGTTSYSELAVTKLEESMEWAIKELNHVVE